MFQSSIHILTDAIRTSILVSGLVCIMMMIIEVVNLKSRGLMGGNIRRHKIGQIILSGFLGSIPGCMGGFASVSLYNHGMISFGALVAMLIASSGDEAFIMLAMFPGKSAMIFVLLLLVAIAAGIVTDLFNDNFEGCRSMQVHEEDKEETADRHGSRHFGWKRLVLTLGVLLFVTALLLGMLDHENDGDPAHFTILSEEWMYWLFSALSIVLLAILLFGEDHFIEEHLWQHIVCHHLPSIMAWTFGTVTVIGFLMHSVDLSAWISGNVAIMILLAALIGLIPESGPHLIFVTMFAAGVVPLPVLLASCISQDGHASLPLLAESRRSWVKAKAINVAVALAVGYAAMLF